MLGVFSVDCRGSNITGWLVITVSFCTTVRPDITLVVNMLGEGVTSGSNTTASVVVINSRVCDKNSSENPGIVRVFNTTALLGAGISVSSGSFTGRLVTISPTLVDVSSGNISTASLVDVSSLTIGVGRGSGVVGTSCRVCVDVGSGNSSKASVISA